MKKDTGNSSLLNEFKPNSLRNHRSEVALELPAALCPLKLVFPCESRVHQILQGPVSQIE